MSDDTQAKEVNNYLAHLEEVLLSKHFKGNGAKRSKEIDHSDPELSRAEVILNRLASCDDKTVSERWSKIETASLVVLLREILKTHYDSDVEMNVRSISNAMSDVLDQSPDDPVACFWKKVQTASLVLLAKQVEAPGSNLRGVRKRVKDGLNLIQLNGSSSVYEKKH